MVKLAYPIKMEIAGDTAMWTRPDTGDCPVSYPAPTYSAVKAIFESILWGTDIEIIPMKVEICAPKINFWRILSMESFGRGTGARGANSKGCAEIGRTE